MAEYIVPITFYGTIEAESAEQAWDKVYKGLSNACGAYESVMIATGMTNVEHTHDEVDNA